jgi:tetratricopeptide (TPR) repeat protein
MAGLQAGKAEISEEVELGRTLLVQGHLETAQRVLLKVCQAQPDCAEALRVLGLVLTKRGEDRRAQVLLEYANEIDAQPPSEIPKLVEDVTSDAETRKNRLAMTPMVRPPVSVKSAEPPAPVLPEPPPAPAPAAPALTLPVPVPAAPAHPAKRRRGGALLAFFAGVALVAGGVAAYSYYGAGKPPRLSPREELERALAAGTLEALMRGRDVARISLEKGEADFDSWVRLGLVNAFLVLDYDVDARKDAERALERASQAPLPDNQRSALLATARALLALAAGDRAAARQHADAAVAAAVPDPPAYAFLASARVRSLAGDAAGAARDLDRAMGIAHDVSPVMVDWAASRLEAGDPVAARRTLQTLLGKQPEYSRARLLLADAERALGEPGWLKSLELACKSDAKISRDVRALCSVGSAWQARLEGDRGGAQRKAKAVSQTTDDPHALAQMSLLLALLGEIDAADELLARAAKAADPAAVALRWADLAIRLGRGEKSETLPTVENPAGPERDLVALRAAYARGGAAGLAAAAKTLPPGIADIDWELRTFMKLEREDAMPKAEAAALEKRAERWNPVASYVLGVFATREKDYKLAARRLEKALAWHGDTCAAAQLYIDAVDRAGKPVQLNKAALKALHARNAKCPVPEL